MSEEHLSHANRATPSNVIRESNLQLAVLLIADSRHEYLNLFNVVLEERTEVTSVAEPEQTSELLLEAVKNRRDLLVVALSFVSILETEAVMQQVDGQMLGTFDLNFVSAEEF